MVRAASEPVIVGEMLHNVLDAALQDVAELVNGVDLHVLIVPEPIELGAVYIIMGIKIILGNTRCFMVCHRRSYVIISSPARFI